MSDRIDRLVKCAVNERLQGWERGQAVAELAAETASQLEAALAAVEHEEAE